MGTSTSAERLDLDRLRNARVALVGYSGGDQAAVEAHVEELARHVVPPPPSVPAVWQVPGELLTHGPQVAVAGRDTSGEVEPGDGDAVVFCGTVPVLDELVLDARAFEAVLEDPVSGRSLSLTYDVVVDAGP